MKEITVEQIRKYIIEEPQILFGYLMLYPELQNMNEEQLILQFHKWLNRDSKKC